MWSLWMSPLIVATDIRNMTDEKKSIVMNEEVHFIYFFFFFFFFFSILAPKHTAF